MKLKIGQIPFYFIFLVFLTNCTPKTEEKPKKTVSRIDLLPGRWKLHMILTDELKNVKQKSAAEYYKIMASMVDSSFMEFSNDSIFIARFGPDLVGGRWVFSSDQRHVITTDLTGAQEVLEILKLTKDSLKLLNLSSQSEITFELSRN